MRAPGVKPGEFDILAERAAFVRPPIKRFVVSALEAWLEGKLSIESARVAAACMRLHRP
jgi:hypothetical protein